jgi:peptidoglycan hydrolase CwlO-like protein
MVITPKQLNSEWLNNTMATIETDLKEILNKLDAKFDRLESKIDNNHKEVTDRLTKVEISITELKGEIKTLDQKLSGEIKNLDTRVVAITDKLGTQEFITRGVYIGIFVAFIGGFLKLFGLIPN